MRVLISKDFIVGFGRMTATEMHDRSLRKLKIEKTLQKYKTNKIEIIYRKSGKPDCSDETDISISHKKNFLVFVAALDNKIQIGCDLELLTEKVNWPLFERNAFTKGEIEKVAEFFETQNKHNLYLALFSAKEAVYKCLGIRPEVHLLKNQEKQMIWRILNLPKVFVVTYRIRGTLFSLCLSC